MSPLPHGCKQVQRTHFSARRFIAYQACPAAGCLLRCRYRRPFAVSLRVSYLLVQGAACYLRWSSCRSCRHHLLLCSPGQQRHLRLRSDPDRWVHKRSTSLAALPTPLMRLRPHGRPQPDQNHSGCILSPADTGRLCRIHPPPHCVCRRSPSCTAQRRGRSPGCLGRRVVVLSVPGAAAMSAPVADDVTVEAAAVRASPPSSEGDLGKMRAHWCALGISVRLPEEGVRSSVHRAKVCTVALLPPDQTKSGSALCQTKKIVG